MTEISEEKTKILLVDDDPMVLDLLVTFASNLGYHPVTATDGRKAVAELEKCSYPIVITDMMMPNMNGMELLNYINEHHQKTGVIVITGYDNTFTYTDVIRAGASDFITKPFSSDELEAKLNRVVREQNLINQLEKLSISDALTGIYNRRYFDVKIWEEAHRADRQRHDVFLLFIDVDKFKEYNDVHGHPAGDRVLQAIGEILRNCIRNNVDLAFRCGGDEFSVILSHITWEQAQMTGRRIMEHYCEREFNSTSLSIGIARFIRHRNNSWQEDISDLIARTDKALYSAKKNGRNLMVTDPETASHVQGLS